MKLWILLFQTALGVVTPGFLQGLEINWKSGGNPHGRVSSQKIKARKQCNTLRSRISSPKSWYDSRFSVHLGPAQLVCDFWNPNFRNNFGSGGTGFLKDIGGYHIRVYHLIISWTTLECNTWSLVEPHKTVTVSYDLTCEVLQSNVVHIKTNCYTLMWFNQWPNNTL